jgi:hypothetical protein
MTNSELTSYSMVNSENFSSKIWDKTKLFTLATGTPHSTESLTRTIRQEKEVKGIQIGILPPFIVNMILYIENPKSSIIKLSELIN